VWYVVISYKPQFKLQELNRYSVICFKKFCTLCGQCIVKYLRNVSVKFVNVQQAKQIYQYKKIKEKL